MTNKKERRKYFVVSDTHNGFTPLKKALSDKGFEEENNNHILIVCGDAFDRLDEAVLLLNFLQKLKKCGRLILIKGNHYYLMWQCLHEINTYGALQHIAHYTNGTVGTIAQLVGDPIITRKFNMFFPLTTEDILRINEGMRDWIDLTQSAVNYCEIGDYIFVHGWIPQHPSYYPEWRNADDNLWERASWTNGMEAWANGIREPNKTIVCGHCHCSYYWSHIKQKRKEFPSKNRKNWQKSFEPAIDDGICAIDACTSYTGIVNVLVFEEEKLNEIKLLKTEQK